MALSYARRAEVSPAPAGIDLIWDIHNASRFCLPRTRGDRPSSAFAKYPSRKSPPHPRGSTRYYLMQMINGTVSPAPAGIDPRKDVLAPDTGRLPRTRGDRPVRRLNTKGRQKSPPHPRGSTTEKNKPYALPVSLPRTRGDRPIESTKSAYSKPSPPHPRGSTVYCCKDKMTEFVSPAPAGIDPALSTQLDGLAGLPRTRGDRPRPCSKSLAS